MNKQIEKKLRKTTSRCPHRRHLVGAVIVSKRGHIISEGTAHTPNIRMTEFTSVHAEIHALGLGRYSDLRGATAYVMATARKSGNVVTGKPCVSCAIALLAAGIETVFYSTPAGMKELNLHTDLSKLKVYRKGERLDD